MKVKLNTPTPVIAEFLSAKGIWTSDDQDAADLLNITLPREGWSGATPSIEAEALELAREIFTRLEVIEEPQGDGEEVLEPLNTAADVQTFSNFKFTYSLERANHPITGITFADDGCHCFVAGRVTLLTWDSTPIKISDGEYTIGLGMENGFPPDSMSLHELAARWWLWKNNLLPESVAENPQALSEADAEVALANHLETMKGEVK